MANKKLLVVEDDHDIAELLKINMVDMGFDVDIAHEGNEGLHKSTSNTYDFIILDIMLPGVDGLEICRQLRARHVDTPILMLTAKSAELDRVIGLETGADDYMTKPFSITELQARVKARMRRIEGAFTKDAGKDSGKGIIRTGNMIIDPEKRKVTVDDSEVQLTAKEFDLLFHFASHPGRVFKRDQLLDSVWGYGFEGYEHTVNSHINRLRTKIEKNPAKPDYILTVWGVGYKFAEPDEL